MRVAFIVGGFPKISETFILTQITGLLDLGHEVDIYARQNPGEAAVQAEVREYHLLRRTRYLGVPATRLRRLCRAARVFATHVWAHPLAMGRCLNPVRYRSAYAILNNIMFVAPFLERRYDVIYCHWGGNGIDFICLKEVFPRTRFITMFHGDDLAIGDEQGPETLALLRRLGDRFLVATDCYGRATLRRYGFDDARIATQRYGIAVKRIAFRERHRAPGVVRLISVARLVDKKGLAFGIRGAAALQAANPGLRIEYRIIGDGPLRHDLDALVRHLGVEGSVELLGALPSTDVLRCMDESDIYVLPSLMEQAGFVLLEAQASGLPVVATRVGGVPDMIVEGRSAVLVPPADSSGIAAALQHLLDHPEAWPAMGREGRRHVEEHHDLDVLKSRLSEVLGA